DWIMSGASSRTAASRMLYWISRKMASVKNGLYDFLSFPRGQGITYCTRWYAGQRIERKSDGRAAGADRTGSKRVYDAQCNDAAQRQSSARRRADDPQDGQAARSNRR